MNPNNRKQFITDTPIKCENCNKLIKIGMSYFSTDHADDVKLCSNCQQFSLSVYERNQKEDERRIAVDKKNTLKDKPVDLVNQKSMKLSHKIIIIIVVIGAIIFFSAIIFSFFNNSDEAVAKRFGVRYMQEQFGFINYSYLVDEDVDVYCKKINDTTYFVKAYPDFDFSIHPCCYVYIWYEGSEREVTCYNFHFE